MKETMLQGNQIEIKKVSSKKDLDAFIGFTAIFIKIMSMLFHSSDSMRRTLCRRNETLPSSSVRRSITWP